MLFTVLSSFHFPSSFLLLYIYYLFPQAATSGSCFPFRCPFLTPLTHSSSFVPLSISETSLFRALQPSHQSPHYPAPFHHPPPLLPSFPSLCPSSLSSPCLLHHLLLSGVSPNFHTAQQPAGLTGSCLHLPRREKNTHIHSGLKAPSNTHTVNSRIQKHTGQG